MESQQFSIGCWEDSYLVALGEGMVDNALLHCHVAWSICLSEDVILWQGWYLNDNHDSCVQQYSQMAYPAVDVHFQRSWYFISPKLLRISQTQVMFGNQILRDSSSVFHKVLEKPCLGNVNLQGFRPVEILIFEDFQVRHPIHTLIPIFADLCNDTNFFSYTYQYTDTNLKSSSIQILSEEYSNLWISHLLSNMPWHRTMGFCVFHSKLYYVGCVFSSMWKAKITIDWIIY